MKRIFFKGIPVTLMYSFRFYSINYVAVIPTLGYCIRPRGFSLESAWTTLDYFDRRKMADLWE